MSDDRATQSSESRDDRSSDRNSTPHEERRTRRTREAHRRPPSSERAHPSREARKGPWERELEREIEPREEAHSHEHPEKTLSYPERFKRWARNPRFNRRGRTDTTRMERRLRHQEREEGAELAALDVVETQDEIIVSCDLPGFEKDEIELHGSDETLRIAAERTIEPDGDIHHRERTAEIERRIDLPAAVKMDEARATYENGVLHVTLPKQEHAREQSITIE